VDEFTTREMARVLTAVAELALLLLGTEKWVTGARATRLRENFELVCELLEMANDRIDKNGDG